MALRVVLADDSMLVREGVRKVLDLQPGITVVGCCGDLDTLLATVDAERPDVVVTDVRMPPTGTDEGIQAASRLRASHPRTGVDGCGAAGYVRKDDLTPASLRTLVSTGRS